MGANALTERGGILLVNDGGDFQAWLTVPGTCEWREISWRPDNYPALHTAEVTATEEELAAYIQKNFVGWTVRKMNLPGVKLDVSGDVLELAST